MNFKQSCYIKKNTTELRNKLEEFGYKYGGSDTKEWGASALYCHDDKYYEIYPAKPSRDHYIIDCGINEELFLALAALRDDTQDYQWYVWIDKDDYQEGEDGLKQYIPGEHWAEWWWFEVRKATVEEIIEHFNKE